MSHFDIGLVDGTDPKSIEQRFREMAAAIHHIGFGNPQDPNDIDSTTLAGSSATAHPGSLENIEGTWVEHTIGTSDANTVRVFHHNLDLPVLNSQPNVRGILMGFSHDGNTADAASTVSVGFTEGDTVAANSIELRVFVGGTRVVDDTHPLTVSLFFIPATRHAEGTP